MKHMCLIPTLFAAVLCVGAQPTLPLETKFSSEEQGARAAVTRFFEGWNEHNADKMVSVFAKDIDHIDVFGEWHRGREAMRVELARLHAGPLRDSHKNYTIEKVRLIKPDVAVVQVLSVSQNGPNLGTFVLEKQQEGWMTVSFANIAPHEPPWKKLDEPGVHPSER